MGPVNGVFHDDPCSADEEVARLRLDFRNTDISTLVEFGILVYDRDANVVRRGPRFDAAASVLDRPDDHSGRLPSNYL